MNVREYEEITRENRRENDKKKIKIKRTEDND